MRFSRGRTSRYDSYNQLSGNVSGETVRATTYTPASFVADCHRAFRQRGLPRLTIGRPVILGPAYVRTLGFTTTSTCREWTHVPQEHVTAPYDHYRTNAHSMSHPPLAQTNRHRLFVIVHSFGMSM